MEFNIGEDDYSQSFQQYVDTLLIKFLKKEDSDMPEIKYTIINDDGDNFVYEKAVVENKTGARTKIAEYRTRIAEIRANMEREYTYAKPLFRTEADIERYFKSRNNARFCVFR